MARQKYRYRYRRPQRRRLKIRRILLPLLLLALLVYPFFEATQLHLDEHTVFVPNLPGNLKNLKIVYLSDIHQGRFFSQQRVDELVTAVNNLSPDLILLGGDYADSSQGAIDFFRNLPPLYARLGVFAIVGNHDRTAPESNLGTLGLTIKEKGIVPLVNAVSRVKVGKSSVTLVGVDDYYNGFPDVAGVARQVTADEFVIFLGHTPDLMPDVLSARSADNDNHWFDLALMGHTHGGQINLFGHTPFRNIAPAVGARYLSGWLEENRAAVLVSNGVGTSVAPVRLLAWPQIHLITLKAR